MLFAIIVIATSCTKEDDPVTPTPVPIQTPVTYTIDKIILADFDMLNPATGDPWDALPNVGPDPFVQIVAGGTILFASVPAANVTVSGPHDMSTADLGTFPITLNYGSQITAEVWENDGGGFVEFIGSSIFLGSNLYDNNNATTFTDVEIAGTTGVRILFSGTFNY